MKTTSRDFQRGAVYKWEDKQFPNMKKGGMTLEACRALAGKMWGAAVHVKDGRGCRNALAYTSRRRATIGLPLWARTPEVVAHEVAHWMVKRTDKGAPAHGGIFVGHYITLLADHCGYDRQVLEQSARAFGLRVLLPEEKAAVA
jgi:hypothetical protein